jgi:uncharacterized protein with HEPN domain
MRPGPDGDALHLDLILEIIDRIQRSLEGYDYRAFLADRDKGDATALRLSAIGESGRKLSDELRSRHPEIDWARMFKLRNIVAHHYDRLNFDILWDVVENALAPLETACRAELKRIDG